MPAGNDLLKAIREPGTGPGRRRIFTAMPHKRRYQYPPYAPDDPRSSKRRRFDAMGNLKTRRTSDNIREGGNKVKDAYKAVKSKAAGSILAQKEGFKSFSLFCFPRLENKVRYPATEYLWGIGPEMVLSEKMHLLWCIVVSRLCELLAGENDKQGGEKLWVIPEDFWAAVGRYIKARRRSVPRSQERSLRNITKHAGSYKAVDWLYLLLNVREFVLEDRIPEHFFKLFMQRCHAGRLIFKSGSSTEV